MEWADGPWICARTVVDDPPGWLKTYRTKASFGRWDVHATTHEDGWQRVTRAIVREVSLLSPAVEPAEPLAQVVLVRHAPAAVSPGPAGAAPRTGNVVIPSNGQLIRRPNIGRVLGVR